MTRFTGPWRKPSLGMLALLVLCPFQLLGAQATATLAGVVRDTVGDPIASAEIVVLGTPLGARTDSAGRFALAGVLPGAQVVRFRRLGFTSVEIDWTAVADLRVDVSVRLDPLPSYLDPVVTYAQEERTSAVGSSTLHGAVLDAEGAPVVGAVMQLVGTGRTTTTGADGSFVFRRLPEGDFVLLARRIGFRPTTAHLYIEREEERELALKLHRLAVMLDTVSVVERSGFGRFETPFQELEARRRWRSASSVTLVGENLRKLYKMPLDEVVKRRGGTAILAGFEKLPVVQRQELVQGMKVAGDVCMLINGRVPMMLPLRFLSADQLERLEIYPPKTEYTGTVGDRLSGFGACQRFGADHPLYIVAWLKGGIDPDTDKRFKKAKPQKR